MERIGNGDRIVVFSSTGQHRSFVESLVGVSSRFAEVRIVANNIVEIIKSATLNDGSYITANLVDENWNTLTTSQMQNYSRQHDLCFTFKKNPDGTTRLFLVGGKKGCKNC